MRKPDVVSVVVNEQRQSSAKCSSSKSSKMIKISKCTYCNRFVAKGLSRCGTCRHAVTTVEVPRGVRHYKHKRSSAVVETLSVAQTAGILEKARSGGRKRSALWTRVVNDAPSIGNNNVMRISGCGSSAQYARELLTKSYPNQNYNVMQRGDDLYIRRT